MELQVYENVIIWFAHTIKMNANGLLCWPVHKILNAFVCFDGIVGAHMNTHVTYNIVAAFRTRHKHKQFTSILISSERKWTKENNRKRKRNKTRTSANCCFALPLEFRCGGRECVPMRTSLTYQFRFNASSHLHEANFCCICNKHAQTKKNDTGKMKTNARKKEWYQHTAVRICCTCIVRRTMHILMKKKKHK